jgi:hypothetical protein
VAEQNTALALKCVGESSMKKLIVSALLRASREGVDAQVAEFPDIKVSAWGVGPAIARLREALWHRMRWTKLETTCAGEPLTPVPTKPATADLAVPIEVEVATEPLAAK